MNKTYSVGIAGLGTVGTGFVNQILKFKSNSQKIANIKISKIAVKNIRKKRNIKLSNLPITTNTLSLAKDKNIDIVIELIGGSSWVAYKLIRESLKNKKHVITANKALLAVHGNELAKIAERNNVSLNYEAAVAGGIPIVKAVRENLRYNNIYKIYGILNGTCNYILTKMENDKGDFKDILKDAQKKGFAELDPSFDINGIDAAHKIVILSSLAFNVKLDFKSTFIEGISKIDSADFKYARELGYTIRLIAMASISKNSVQQRVHPCFIKKSSDVAKIVDETNAIIVQDKSIGKNIFQGPGAGSGPTGASVLSDLMDILRGTRNLPLGTAISKKLKAKIDNIEDLSFSYYLRIKAKDKPGVLAKISKALSSQKISIESIIQNPPVQTQNAEIILVLHKTKESMLLSALKKIRKIKDVGSSVKFIRIENSIWLLFQINMRQA